MARGLTVDRVVGAAIELADADGLAAVSMARVAERLGFTPMSLYRHVSGKDELVRRMLDAALGTPSPFAVDGWRARLEAWARGLLAVLDRHPWGIDIPITGMLGTRAQLAWLDRGLEAFADTALGEDEKAGVVLLLNGYVFWTARLRFQVPDEGDLPVVPEGFDLTDYPSLARAVESGIFEDDTTREEDFEFGLESVLDGVA
ncbi:MAG TPA: TetR/AcrR family transcriptional regulator, partial [Solirubrobacter sp.]|nr:TetR/AcrR family transcriptional regulator [Solirubrobacter sp.]